MEAGVPEREGLLPDDDDDDDLQHAVATVDQKKGDHDDFDFGVPEAGVHDQNVLPHHHSPAHVEKLVPKAVTDDDDGGTINDYEADDHEIVYGPGLR